MQKSIKLPTIPLVCNLSAIVSGKRNQHIDKTKQLFAQHVNQKELADGIGFEFPNSSETILALAEFIANERQCCAFFDFQLDIQAGSKTLWLNLTGPDGVKAFLRDYV